MWDWQNQKANIERNCCALGFFDFMKKQPSNSLEELPEEKKMFLVNYLVDRSITWHIDDPVKERYPNIDKNIEDLQKDGLIKKEKGVFALTDSGLEMRKIFRSKEKARREQMHQNVLSYAMAGNYLEAYNERAKYEQDSIIPHGICAPLGRGADEVWGESASLPYNVKNYIKASYKLDFSDCENSEQFKEALRRFYVGMEITGAELDPADNFEEQIGETLICPALDAQLKEKCHFPRPPKLKIYFRTKVRVFNFINTKIIEKWDGNFDLGIYDCTSPLHASMAQYEMMKDAKIEKFPKTFQTFEKHKKANDSKYKDWMEEYSMKMV